MHPSKTYDTTTLNEKNQAVIAAHQVVKTYGKGDAAFTALKDVDLEIAKGETVAIIGKSGSGKSTLMHLLALLDKPTSGTIMVESQDAAHLSGRSLNKFRNKKFGFVFQQFFLNGNASVLENVILPLKIGRVGRSERKRRGLEALRQVDLEDKANNKAVDLSGGQKQRVVIARALINNPEVIFADEPTGNLDSVTGKLIEDLLFSLNKEHGIMLIFVTHDEDLARRTNRRLHIKDGVLDAPVGRATASPAGRSGAVQL
jgi:putative ABC transport system ATP-binding protein